MNPEKKRFIHAMTIPVFLLFIMWAIKLIEIGFDIKLSFLGVHPLHPDGLFGIVTMPFVHGDLNHLLANSGSFFILGTALFYLTIDI